MRATVWGTIRAGEVAELLVILLCIAGAAWAVFLSVSMRHGALLPPLVVSQMEHLLSAGEVEKAKELCVEKGSLRNVLFAGLARIDRDPGSRASAVGLAAKKEATRFRRRAGYLLLVAILVLLLGLVTTVGELIEIYDKIARLRGFVNPSDQADGLAASLLPSYVSAIGFVPLFCGWWFFRDRAEMLAHEIEMTADDLISRVGTDVAGEERAKT